MDDIFKALADTHRRAILDQLHQKDGQTLSDLEAHFPEMTRFGVMKHLKILEAANLVVSHKKGRFKYHYLNPVPLAEISQRWLSPLQQHQANAIVALKTELESKE